MVPHLKLCVQLLGGEVFCDGDFLASAWHTGARTLSCPFRGWITGGLIRGYSKAPHVLCLAEHVRGFTVKCNRFICMCKYTDREGGVSSTRLPCPSGMFLSLSVAEVEVAFQLAVFTSNLFQGVEEVSLIFLRAALG